MSDIAVSLHAIARYRERCPDAAKLADRTIVARLRKMARDPDSIKLVKHGRFLICGEWVLIQAENLIVTVYQGDQKSILRKRINPRKNQDDQTDFDSCDVDGAKSVRKRRRKDKK